MNPAELVRDMHARIEELERQIAEAQAREKGLRGACQLAHDACQDNLKMYQYKNEPVLMDAFHAARAALALPSGTAALDALMLRARREEREACAAYVRAQSGTGSDLRDIAHRLRQGWHVMGEKDA